jgi:hypothetical protein
MSGAPVMVAFWARNNKNKIPMPDIDLVVVTFFSLSSISTFFPL